MKEMSSSLEESFCAISSVVMSKTRHLPCSLKTELWEVGAVVCNWIKKCKGYVLLKTGDKIHIGSEYFDKNLEFLCWFVLTYMAYGGKQWQTIPKNVARMQHIGAIPVAWLGSGSCQTDPRAEYQLLLLYMAYTALHTFCVHCYYILKTLVQDE